MTTATVTKHGEVALPTAIRRKLRLAGGARVRVYEKNGEIRLVPITERWIREHAGFLKTRGRLLRALRDEKNREREF